MGTTKLTRKEILTEDPVHEAIIQLIDFFRTRGKAIAATAVGIAVLAIGGYLGVNYLQAREQQMQHQLSRGLNAYHAKVDPNAPENPYAKGPEPTFRSEDAKYQAAIREFSDVASKFAAGKTGVMAKYYLGLCRLRLGQNAEALRALEEVRSNTKDRTIAYLAKKVLAKHYLNTANYRVAQELLDGMIRDPQCDLPKEDLKVDLARLYEAQGKRDEALKVLRKAREEEGKSGLQQLVTQELNRLEGSTAAR